jgi:hypothetical protein
LRRRNFFKLSLSAFGYGFLLSKEAVSGVFNFALSKFHNLYFPDHPQFSSLNKIFNKLIIRPEPLAISLAESAGETSELFLDKSLQDVPVLMRSGGHSYAGFSTGKGLVLDSRKLKQITHTENSVLLGAGLTLKEAQDQLAPSGLTFPSGEFPGVGIAGYFLGGGHSRRSRYLGLGADCVKSLSVTLASGDRIQHVSPMNHADLYWALLGGGGGNFAYVDAFEIEKISSFNEYFFKYTFPASVANERSDLFSFWEQAAQRSPENVAVNMTIYINNGYISKLIISGLVMNSYGNLEEIENEFKKSSWVDLDQFNPSSFESNLSNPNFIRPNRTEGMFFKGASHYADREIGDLGFEHIQDSIRRFSKGSNMYMGLYSMGGKIHHPAREISYPHRDSLYMIDLFSNFREDTNRHQLYRQNFNSLYQSLEGLFSGRSYVNYPDPDFGDDWAHRYYGSSLERLVQVKRKYDPANKFDFGSQSLSSFLTR